MSWVWPTSDPFWELVAPVLYCHTQLLDLAGVAKPNNLTHGFLKVSRLRIIFIGQDWIRYTY